MMIMYTGISEAKHDKNTTQGMAWHGTAQQGTAQDVALLSSDSKVPLAFRFMAIKHLINDAV